MSRYFFLIVTEPGNAKIEADNAKTLGDVRFILQSAFVLSMSNEMDISDIRSIISGENRLRCLIIALDAYIVSAWNLSKDNSDHLKAIFSEIYGQKEDADK